MGQKPEHDMNVGSLVGYLIRQCSGTRTSGCDCPTCILAINVTYHAQQYQKRMDAALDRIQNGA